MNAENQKGVAKKLGILDTKLTTIGSMRLLDDELLQPEADKIKAFISAHSEKICTNLDWLVKNPQQKGKSAKKVKETFSF